MSRKIMKNNNSEFEYDSNEKAWEYYQKLYQNSFIEINENSEKIVGKRIIKEAEIKCNKKGKDRIKKDIYISDEESKINLEESSDNDEDDLSFIPYEFESKCKNVFITTFNTIFIYIFYIILFII